VKCQGVLLDPAAYGHLVLMLNLVGLVQNVLFIGPSSAALRYAAVAQDAGQGRDFAVVLRALMVRRLLVVLLFAVGVGPLLVWKTELTPVVLLTCLGLGVAGAIAAVYENWLLSLRRQSGLAITQLAFQVVRLGGMCIGVGLLLWGEFGAIAGLASAAVFLWIVLLLQMPAFSSGGTSTRDWRAVAGNYAGPFLIWSATLWSQQAAERWVLQWHCDAHAVGLYGGAYQICFAPITMASAMVANYAAPRIFQRWAVGAHQNDELRRWHRIGLWGMAVSLLAAGVTFLLAGPILTIGLSSAWHPAAVYLPLLVLSASCFGLGQAISTPLLAISSKTINAPKIIMPIIGIMVACTMIPVFGPMGAAIASVLSNVGYLLWVLHRLHHAARSGARPA